MSGPLKVVQSPDGRALTNTETGETIPDAVLAVVFQRPKMKEEFVMLLQKAVDQLSEDPSLTQRDLRLLLKLMAKLDFQNYLRVSQTDLSTELRIHKSDVSKSMSTLVRRGVLLKGPKVGNGYTYRMSPSLGWKGSAKSHAAERTRHLRVVHDRAKVKA